MASRYLLSVTDAGGITLPYSSKRGVLREIGHHLKAIAAGARGGSNTVRLSTAGVQATGTFTTVSAVATDAITVNGVTFTAVASGATGNQFNIGANDAATATNIAAAINASATDLVSKHVTASAASNVVTITAVLPGHAGNAVTITSAVATITASGARLTGGTETTTSYTY